MAKSQQQINYERVAKAIAYMLAHFRNQPSLDQLAEVVHMSPFHFQRLFTEWAGTSPKKFIQYLSIAHAKSLLQDKSKTLFDTYYDTGLSSSSRLHDLFIQIEGMSPKEYQNGGRNLQIAYSFQDTHFGPSLVASTDKGICYLAFVDNEPEAIYLLQKQFPNAHYLEAVKDSHLRTQSFLQGASEDMRTLKLHLKGTAFQLKIWEALLKIPLGQLSTYGAIARQVDNSKAARAVGTAIGANPVAYLIPCHRVIQASGVLGGYRWDPLRKASIIAWESAKNETENEII